MTTKVDWCLDSHTLKRLLLHLSKSQLIKICKSKKVSTNGNKKELIDNLLNQTKQTTYRKKQKPKKQKTQNIKLKKSKKNELPSQKHQKQKALDKKQSTPDASDDEDTEYRIDARKRELLVYGYVRAEFEEENYDMIIFPSEIKTLLKLFVALFGWDIMKKGNLIKIDNLNDYQITKISNKKYRGKKYQTVCFSEVLISPYQYYFKLKIRSCKTDGIFIGVVKTAGYESYINDRYHIKQQSSRIFALCSDGMILERKCKRKQTKQWIQNDILDVFVDMDELEMSFKLNDVEAKNIIDTVGDEYYFLVSLAHKNDSVELLNYTIKGEIQECYSNDDWLFEDDDNDISEHDDSESDF